MQYNYICWRTLCPTHNGRVCRVARCRSFLSCSQGRAYCEALEGGETVIGPHGTTVGVENKAFVSDERLKEGLLSRVDSPEGRK